MMSSGEWKGKVQSGEHICNMYFQLKDWYPQYKNSTVFTKNCGKDMEQLVFSYIAGRSVNWYNSFGCLVGNIY